MRTTLAPTGIIGRMSAHTSAPAHVSSAATRAQAREHRAAREGRLGSVSAKRVFFLELAHPRSGRIRPWLACTVHLLDALRLTRAAAVRAANKRIEQNATR